MTKEEVQQRVLQNGKPLAMSKFSWDEKTNTFSSKEDDLVIDFKGTNYCTFKTGSNCTFKTGSDCTFDTSWNCTFNTSWNCTFDTGSDCTFNTGSDCTFDTGSECTFKTGSNCTFKTEYYCTFNTGFSCTFNTGLNCTFNTAYNCTFKTGWNCTFKTGSYCIFNTSSYCTFKTSSDCTFDTGSDCTFNTGSSCTFKTGSSCGIIRQDIFKIIQPKENEKIQLLPYEVKGYLRFDEEKQIWLNENGEDSVVIDGIYSVVKSRKNNVLKVVNYGEEEESYIVTDGENFAHGRTIKEAKEDLIYKISNRDTSMYNDFTLDTSVTIEEGIKMYRRITGACFTQTKSFVENLERPKKSYTVKEIIELTRGRFENNVFENFFNK